MKHNFKYLSLFYLLLIFINCKKKLDYDANVSTLKLEHVRTIRHDSILKPKSGILVGDKFYIHQPEVGYVFTCFEYPSINYLGNVIEVDRSGYGIRSPGFSGQIFNKNKFVLVDKENLKIRTSQILFNNNNRPISTTLNTIGFIPPLFDVPNDFYFIDDSTIIGNSFSGTKLLYKFNLRTKQLSTINFPNSPIEFDEIKDILFTTKLIIDSSSKIIMGYYFLNKIEFYDFSLSKLGEVILPISKESQYPERRKNGWFKEGTKLFYTSLCYSKKRGLVFALRSNAYSNKVSSDLNHPSELYCINNSFKLVGKFTFGESIKNIWLDENKGEIFGITLSEETPIKVYKMPL